MGLEDHALGGQLVRFRSGRGTSQSAADAVFRRADLLLNFHYGIDPGVLARLRRTPLVDIDSGLLHLWMSRGQLLVSLHDLYLTIGETVGTPEGGCLDCGLHWTHIRLPVCVEAWPYTYDPASRRFTTASSWLGGEYVTDGDRVRFRNDKRISFLQFLGLPARTSSELELALYFKPSPDAADADDPELFQRNGWRVRHALEVASTPER